MKNELGEELKGPTGLEDDTSFKGTLVLIDCFIFSSSENTHTFFSGILFWEDHLMVRVFLFLFIFYEFFSLSEFRISKISIIHSKKL